MSFKFNYIAVMLIINNIFWQIQNSHNNNEPITVDRSITLSENVEIIHFSNVHRKKSAFELLNSTPASLIRRLGLG